MFPAMQQMLREDLHERVVIYARISKDKLGLELGVERQVGKCREHAAMFGWNVVEVLVDNDISAFDGSRRPEYERMLEMIADGEVTLVLSFNQDRLLRDMFDTGDYIKLTRRMRVPTYTTIGGFLDVNDPHGRKRMWQEGLEAQYSSDLASMRIKLKKSELAAKGKFLGGPRPFGYEEGGMVLRESEAEEIRAACEALLAGASLRSIARDWNERGVPRPRGKRPWSPCHVKQTLAKPRLMGMLVHLGEVKGRAQWPAVVSEQTWGQVQAVLEGLSHKRPGDTSGVRWLGSGIYECGGCGKSTMIAGAAGPTGKAYVCQRTKLPRSMRQGETHVTRKAVSLDEYVEGALVSWLGQPGEVARLVEATTPSEVVDVGALLAERVELSRMKESLVRMRVRREIDESQLRAGNEEADARLRQIEDELSRAGGRSPLAALLDARDVAEAWYGTREDRSDGLPIEVRRDVLRLLLKVTVLPAGRGGLGKKGVTLFDPSKVLLEQRV